MLMINEFESVTGIRITTNHTGKMTGLCSVSTSPVKNPLCKARINNPDMICSKCYSVRMNRMYKRLNDKLEINSDMLTREIIPVENMPVLYSPSGLFRFEAFGDLINEIQVVNYFNMAAYNPALSCGLWTKNPWIIKNAIEHYGLEKPANLKIIGSSYKLNEDMENYYKQYDFIDNCFTVYSPEFISDSDIKITCGARSCATCRKCYEGTHNNYNIAEKLK